MVIIYTIEEYIYKVVRLLNINGYILKHTKHYAIKMIVIIELFIIVSYSYNILTNTIITF